MNCNYEIKKKCFAYNSEKNMCIALDKLYCKSEKCNFFKTKEQNQKEKLIAEARVENKTYHEYKM